MVEQKNFITEIIEEHEDRMQNVKKYFPFFAISDTNLTQFKDGKYASLDMGFILLAILRMFIEENNFNDTGVTYRKYASFVSDLIRNEFKMNLTEEENEEIISYIFNKIKNDGKPFEYQYYDPVERKQKTTRVWLIKSNFYQGNIYYYITDTGIEFYLDTKEIKEESNISIQQLLLEKMIKSRNFSGGREIVKRICNEVSKLKVRKNEVLNVMSHDIKEGLRLYEKFMEHSGTWFEEEHQLFMKNSALIETAMSMMTPMDITNNREEIFLLDTELKQAIAKHSELLYSCMDLKKKSDELVLQSKMNVLKTTFDFRNVVDHMEALGDNRYLDMITSPLLQPKIAKTFHLERLDDLLTCRPNDEEIIEEVKELQEEDYIYDDVLEDIRISENFIKFLDQLFEMLCEHDSFTLKDYNSLLEKRFTKRIFVNGDYYSFIIHMCQKYQYTITESLKNPTTFFENSMVSYFALGEMVQYKELNFNLYPIPEEQIELPSSFSVTNIRFERSKNNDESNHR